jgi:hypothetical protein
MFVSVVSVVVVRMLLSAILPAMTGIVVSRNPLSAFRSFSSYLKSRLTLPLSSKVDSDVIS